MKRSLALFILLLPFDLAAQDYSYYAQAFEKFIENSEEYKSQSCYRRGNAVIAKEIVPFNKLSYLFESQIDSAKDSTTFPKSDKAGLTYKQLTIGKRKSRMKIFFTDMRDGIFFAEATCTKSKAMTSYEKLSPFGSSVIFMFMIDATGEIQLVNVSAFSNL